MTYFYRLGSSTPKNFTPREQDIIGEGRGLSVQVVEPVIKHQKIDAEVLKITQAVNTPVQGNPLHYSLLTDPDEQESLEQWAATRAKIPDNDNNWTNVNVSTWSHDIKKAVVVTVTLGESGQKMNVHSSKPVKGPNAKVHLPAHKADTESAIQLAALTDDMLRPYYRDLLVWLQDFNWPVAQVLAPRLAKVGLPLKEAVVDVLESNDSIWKYWVVSQVVKEADPALATAVRQQLERQGQNLTAQNDEDETNLVDVIADVLNELDLRHGK